MSLMLSCPQFSETIAFQENTVHTLVLENPTACYAFLSDWVHQQAGGDGQTVLSENFTPISIAKYAELITEPLTVQPNTRTVLTKLYAQLSKTANDESHFAALSELQTSIENFLYAICESQESDLTFSQGIEFSQLLKGADVQFDFSSERPLAEKLLDYMRICREYLGTKLFVLYNVKAVVEKSELEALCQELFYRKIPILLVQSTETYRLSNEIQWILDNDLCEIY